MFGYALEKEHGIPMANTKGFFMTTFNECLEGKLDLKTAIAPYLKEWGWENSIENFLLFWFKAEHSADEQLIALIEKLRRDGNLCYLATNQEKHRLEYMKNEMHFSELFDGIISSAEVGYKKPKWKFFEKMMEKIPTKEKSDVLFFDDSQSNVDAARAFGINAQLFTGLQEFRKMLDALGLK